MRAIEERDLELLRELHNDPEVLYMVTDSHMINQEEQKLWYKAMTCSNTSKRFVVFFKASEEIIGLIRMDMINHTNRSMNMGFDLFKEYRGKRLGETVFALLFKYGFEEMNMNRLWGWAAEFNPRMVKLCVNVGLKIEGRARQAFYRNGEYHDCLYVSMLREDYLKLKKQGG